MNEIDILRQLFRTGCLIELQDDYGKPFVRLQEPGDPDSCVDIVHVPDDLLAIDLDANFSNESLFQSGTGVAVCKRSDYLLISVDLQCALFVEMKRSSAQGSSVRKQLLGGLCVFEYIDRVVFHFYNTRFLTGYQQRFVALLDTVLPKRPTKQRAEPLHDSPENMLRIRGMRRVQFNQLARLNA